MGAKKIIITIAIAAIVACGVGYYCYNTVKASTLSSSEMADTTNSSTALGSTTSGSSENVGNTNISGSITKSASAINNDTNTKIISKASDEGVSASSNTLKITETTSSNNDSDTSSRNISTTEKASSTSKISSKKVWVYTEGYVPSDCAYVLVRSEPNSTSSVITTLSTGAKFFVVSECNNWAYVQTGSKSGYIPMWYITFTAPTSNAGNSSSNTNSQNLSQLKQGYLKQLNNIVTKIGQLPEVETDVQEVNRYEREVGYWNTEMSNILNKLYEVLPSSEVVGLKASQEEYMDNVSDKINKIKNEGGSISYVISARENAMLIEDRCYELVDNYM